MSGHPLRHHYLSQGYLRGFSAGNGKLFVWSRATGKVRPQTARNTAVRRNYFSAQLADGTRNYEWEQFRSTIEGRAIPVIRRLECREQCSSEELEYLAAFIALLITQTPGLETELNAFGEQLLRATAHHVVADEKLLDEILKVEAPEMLQPEAAEKGQRLKEFVTKNEYRIKFHRNHSLITSAKLMPAIAEMCYRLNWIFVYCPPDTLLLTSDYPLVIFGEGGVASPFRGNHGLLSQGVKKFVPLSKSLGLLMTDEGEAVSEFAVDTEMVKELNRAMAFTCHELLIGHNDKQLVDALAGI